jgi:hypothetical protein
MKRKSTNGLAILAGGMAFVGTAQAVDVIVDGNFENTTGGAGDIVRNGGTPNPGVGGGWSTFSTYLYSTEYANAAPTNFNFGIQFLRPYNPQTITQLVSLTNLTGLTTTDIDGGQGRYTVSAWFSSYLSQGDYSVLTVDFLDASSSVVGSSVPLGGLDFVAAIPTGPSSPGSTPKYPNGKDWAQDSQNATIPSGARTARVIITSTAVSGQPDGYVDLVSLDITASTDTAPALVQAFPANNAINVDPLVNIAVTLQDRATAVNTNSIQLFLDNSVVSPSIQKVGTNTTVQYAPGALPALSPHTYKIVFGDNGVPVTTKTNVFQFTVADYPTLPISQRTPLGSEDTTKPGFNVKVYQVETLTDLAASQFNIEDDISLSEAVLAGLVGTNVADLTTAVGNTFAVTDVINWVNLSGATANFPNDTGFPGIPGTLGSEDSFADEISTFVRFPTAGYYRMGVNNEDQFRLSGGTEGTLVLQISGPTNVAIPCVTMATNIIFVGFGGALPMSPLTAPIAYATPSGNPEDACNIATNTALAGKVVLLDRGGVDCNDAAKAKQAQLAGAAAVLMTTPGDTGFPFRLGSDDATITIPVLVIAENYGAALLKSYLTNSVAVSATIRGDPNPRIAEWDNDKGFGAVNVIGGFAVPAAGVYPLRLVAGHMGAPGGAAARANLEWFSVKPDETKILVNDTSNPDSLRTFRARTTPQISVMNPPIFSGGNVTISWTGAGTLEEATTITGPWSNSTNQNNPQTVPATGDGKFYRIRQ